MNLTYAERKEMNELSLFVFGVSSRWQKLVTKGYSKTLTEKSEEMVPGKDGAEDTVQEIDVPVRYGNSNTAVFRTTYHTVESIRERMLAIKAWKLEMIAAEEAKKAAAAQKALETEVNSQLGGSAV